MENKSVLSLVVDVETKIMQQKLRAIAKHATALADELEQIDKGDDGQQSSHVTQNITINPSVVAMKPSDIKDQVLKASRRMEI